MDFFVLLTVVSAICSIVGLVFALYIAKYPKAKKWLWGIAVFALTFISGLAVHYNSENERIKNIHRQAEIIISHHEPYGFDKAFIQESLTFLEENKDRYPDSYERAKQIYETMKNSHFQYGYEPAMEIEGILKGIAALNE